MKQSDVVVWVHDEIKSVLNTTSLLSLNTPDDHVDLADDREDHPYPFVGIRKSTTRPQSAGIGSGGLYVDALNYDNNDVLDSIDYAKDIVLRLLVIPTTDDDAKLREDLTEELANHFELQLRQDNLHSDMKDLDVEEGTPQGRPDDFVRADGLPLEIEYKRTITDSDPTAAETVNMDVDIGDYDDDISESSDVDGFDETFN